MSQSNFKSFHFQWLGPAQAYLPADRLLWPFRTTWIHLGESKEAGCLMNDNNATTTITKRVPLAPIPTQTPIPGSFDIFHLWWSTVTALVSVKSLVIYLRGKFYLLCRFLGYERSVIASAPLCCAVWDFFLENLFSSWSLTHTGSSGALSENAFIFLTSSSGNF